MPAHDLLASLRGARGPGRPDYPLEVLGGTLGMALALRHVSSDACLEDRRRPAALRLLLGIEAEDRVPGPDNRSRFLVPRGAEPHRPLLRAVFDATVQRRGLLGDALGQDTAGDSTGLSGRSARSAQRRAAESEHGLPQPSGGKKQYQDADGQVAHVVACFGYQRPRFVEVKHAVALASHSSDTKAGDHERVPQLVQQAQQRLPPQRLKTLADDKAAADRAVHEFLHEEGMKPILQIRNCKLEEPEKVLGGRVPLPVVFHQQGPVGCYDRVRETTVKHKRADIGHEAARGPLKDRCPARHEGWDCPSAAPCNGDRSHGWTVRVHQETERRRVPSIPRATKQFERLYGGRTAVERVTGRRQLFWGIDDGQVAGSRRLHAQVGAVLVVQLAFATLLAQAARSEGTFGKRTLPPLAKALRERIETSALAAAESTPQ